MSNNKNYTIDELNQLSKEELLRIEKDKRVSIILDRQSEFLKLQRDGTTPRQQSQDTKENR